MKRLAVGFDGVLHGHLFIRDGKICAEGPNVFALQHHAEAAGMNLAYRGDESKMTPEGILDHMAETLQGRAHAEWEGDGDGNNDGAAPGRTGRVEKGFDESAVSREKAEHDGKRPGEFAPKVGASKSDTGDSSVDTPAEPASKPKAKAAPKLTDEQRDALRSLADLFPDGLAGLIDAKGRIDRDAAFPEEVAAKKRIAALREKWEATDAKIKNLLESDAKATERADADIALNDKLNDEICGADDVGLTAGDFLDHDTDHETFDAIEAIETAVQELTDGPVPESEDALDEDDYVEDDFPEDNDDPLDDQESAGKDAVRDIAKRLKKLEVDVVAHEKNVVITSAKWRKDTRELLEGLQKATEAALAIPAEKYHAASKAYEVDPNDYTPDDIDDTLARVKLLHDRSKAILAEMK